MLLNNNLFKFGRPGTNINLHDITTYGKVLLILVAMDFYLGKVPEHRASGNWNSTEKVQGATTFSSHTLHVYVVSG